MKTKTRSIRENVRRNTLGSALLFAEASARVDQILYLMLRGHKALLLPGVFLASVSVEDVA